MPYYCTVPRCTSMAGKVKNVSFHQFPRDEELASLWNKILKRGKPYTKYSKVCSLHFRPEDYTITSVGKNKGQWRTLRKDAIPSQNLPLESPGPSRMSGGYWMPNVSGNVPDPQILSVQQQVAQAIYLQTMLATQAAANGSPHLPTQSANLEIPTDLTSHRPTTPPTSYKDFMSNLPNGIQLKDNVLGTQDKTRVQNSSFQCQECSKCFKDPDVFMLHRRTHKNIVEERFSDNLLEKENLHSNNEVSNDEMLKANPILANLLKNGVSSDVTPNFSNAFDVNNILSIENQIMAALAVSMESYIRNLSMLQAAAKKKDCDDSMISNDNSEIITNDNSRENDMTDEGSSSNENFVEESKAHVFGENFDEKCLNLEQNQRLNGEKRNWSGDNSNNYEKCNENDLKHNKIDNKDLNFGENNLNQDLIHQNLQENHINHHDNYQDDNKNVQNDENIIDFSNNITQDSGNNPNCDNEDLNESKDSNNLVIDESV